MDKKIFFSMLIMSSIILASIFVYTINSQPVSTFDKSVDSTDDSIAYSGNVCVVTSGEFDGRTTPAHEGVEELVGCSHNLLTTAGLNLVRDYLTNDAATNNVSMIALCNATNCSGPLAADTGLSSEFLAGGLTRAPGTITYGGNGNWTIVKTFTATGNNLRTNVTGLFNGTAAEGAILFAENNFTLVTLETSDQVTINWSISVS